MRKRDPVNPVHPVQKSLASNRRRVQVAQQFVRGNQAVMPGPYNDSVVVDGVMLQHLTLPRVTILRRVPRVAVFAARDPANVTHDLFLEPPGEW